MAGGHISDDDIQKIREATDLVALVGERVQLRQRGREFWGCCPLHHEKTPSFKIDPVSQTWHCFGCDEGGDALSFVMKADDLSFPEAVRKLAERAHIEIQETASGGASSTKKQRLRDVCRSTAEFYHLQLMRGRDQASADARAYLAKRGLGGEVPKKWMLGYSPGRSALVSHLLSKGFTLDEMMEANVATASRDGKVRDRFFTRVMFPIRDVAGDFIAFGGRVIGQGSPKYLNTRETPIFHKTQVLFGLDRAKASMASTGTAVVTEGYTDVIAMHEAGVTNAVATLGTALSQNHIRQLARHAGKRIVYIFDGDAAGQRATERALMFIDETVTPEYGKSRIDICALCLPDGMDPAEYLAANSAEEMQRLIAGAQPLIRFGIERRMAKHDRGTAEGRAAALADALDVLAPIKDSILAKDYAVFIAGALRLREEDVLAQLAATKKPKRFESDDAWDGPDKRGASDVQDSGRPPRQTVRLSVADRNRIALEREFLGMCAQNPVEALEFADSIENVKWRSPAHLDIAESIVATLMEDLGASSAQIIERASAKVPQAASMLTATRTRREGVSVSRVLAFCSEGLCIGDMEDELADLRARMAHAADADESNALFRKTVDLQEKLNRLKSRHTPL